MREVARGPIGKLTVCSTGEVDPQCADNGIVQRSSGIRVEGKSHVYRNVQSFFRRIYGRTAAQVVHPQPSAFVIIGIVIAALAQRVDAVGHTGPLHPIAGCFAETRVSADCRHRAFLTAACYISHATADFHSIGRDDLSFFSCAIA